MNFLTNSKLRSAWVIAHPAHELRVFHWLDLLRPRVHVLTNGSGRTGGSRLNSTGQVLALAAATAGSIFGRYSDREIYNATLHVDRVLFAGLANELATALIADEIDLVFGDTEESEFMAHDLWRAVRIAAVRKARRVMDKPILHYEFVVDGDPRLIPSSVEAETMKLELDDRMFARKLAAGYGYAEVAPLVHEALKSFGHQSFRTERLFPCDEQAVLCHQTPGYERRGETLVAQGVYPAVIRRDQHLLPILSALDYLEQVAQVA